MKSFRISPKIFLFPIKPPAAKEHEILLNASI